MSCWERTLLLLLLLLLLMLLLLMMTEKKIERERFLQRWEGQRRSDWQFLRNMKIQRYQRCCSSSAEMMILSKTKNERVCLE